MSLSFAYLNFDLLSGSHYSPPIPSPNFIPPVKAGNNRYRFANVVEFGAASETIIITESLTVKYFQRVWDIDNSQWCYYTQTAINAAPGTSDTQPTNSGNITSASVVQILDIY